MRLVHFSSVSGNTHRFVDKLDQPSLRLPLYRSEPTPQVAEPFVLITPTYGGVDGGDVPKQVIKFLNLPENRALIRGVIGAGNTNFGEHYCRAADIVAAKTRVPVLYRFELMGTGHDVATVSAGLEEFWTRQ